MSGSSATSGDGSVVTKLPWRHPGTRSGRAPRGSRLRASNAHQSIRTIPTSGRRSCISSACSPSGWISIHTRSSTPRRLLPARGRFRCGGEGGLVRIAREERFHFEHPEYLHRMILLGRLFAVTFASRRLGFCIVSPGAWGSTGWEPARGAPARDPPLPHGSQSLHDRQHGGHVLDRGRVSRARALAASRRPGESGVVGIAAGLALSTKYTAILLIP